jgi:hypothetical protein
MAQGDRRTGVNRLRLGFYVDQQDCPTVGVEPRRHQTRGKGSGCQDSARDTMVFNAGAAITHQYANAVGSNAELASTH